MPHLTRLAFRLSAIAFFALSPFLLAQDNMQNGQGTMSEGKTAGTHHMINITGCLKKGSEANGYYITDQDGKTWELSSKSVDLSQHINHTVSVAGHEVKQSKEQESKAEQSEKSEASGNQYSDLHVSQLKMVSPSCTQ